MRLKAIFLYITFLAECASTVVGDRPKMTYAALGDSYAAGDGAGSSKLLPNFDLTCARFTNAYPVWVANSTKLEVTKFNNIACGGAVSTSVLKTQVPRIAESDVVTIQVGGNEIDFFVLLNECVQQWRPFSTCERELVRARELVQSFRFLDNFNALVSGAKSKLRSDAKLLMLGYARFFNDETEQCNTVSFSSKHPESVLTQVLRNDFNRIVTMLNEVILGVAEAHGAMYVNIDDVFDGHRFCERGVVEPSPDASWFFSDIGRHPSSMSYHHEHFQDQLVFPNPFKDFLNFTSTFHPTSEGHIAIAKEILRMLDTE